MTMRITFTDTVGVSDAYIPKPAIQCIPEWFKETQPYVDGVRAVRDGVTTHTIKKCIPVWDAMSAGYIIPTFTDIYVDSVEGSPSYAWPAFNALGFQNHVQAPIHPSENGYPFPKWMSPWSIKTDRGYSCLFLPPMHHPNDIFTVMPGMVDTDSYNIPVNFPFTLNDPAWTGVIPAGTPMVQVIPFKRDVFKMRLGGDEERALESRSRSRLVSLWFNSYKRQFWARKEYR